MALVSLVVYLASPYLGLLFTSHPEAIAASRLVAFYSFLGTAATSGTLIYTATWQGLGNAKFPMYATMVGMWGIRLCLGYVFTIYLGWGLSGVWIATIVDNIFRWFFLAFSLSRRW